jgi:beta-N-acetylhexosaminidase
MNALSGDLQSRARDCLAAGCDLALACSGRIEDALALAGTVPSLDGEAAIRYANALQFRPSPEPSFDIAADEHHLAATNLVA